MEPISTTESYQLFHSEIKNATKEFHQKLEALPLSASLMAADITRHDYGKYLAAMRGVIEYSETLIFSLATSVVTDLNQRHKLLSIDTDIEALHLPDFAFLKFSGLDQPISLERALGFLYVIEGSTLGGRMIAKHLSGSSIGDIQNFSRFFSGYKDETGMMWKTFLATLSAFASESKSRNEIISGAVQTFQLIHDHFHAFSKLNEN